MTRQKISIIKSCKHFLIPILVIAIAACGKPISEDAQPSSADDVAPVISNLAHSSIGTTTAIITWLTDEASDSQVEYGNVASGIYGSSTTLNTTLTTTHSEMITGLTSSETYNYRAVSADASLNSTTSANGSFSTGVSGSSVTFTWTAPVFNSDGITPIYDLAGYKLYYSTTSGNVSATAFKTVDVLGANMSSYLESTLGAGTYYAVIKAYDTSGNLSAESNEETFTIT